MADPTTEWIRSKFTFLSSTEAMLLCQLCDRLDAAEADLAAIYGLNERGDSLIGDIWRLALACQNLCKLSDDKMAKAMLPQIEPLITQIERRMEQDDPGQHFMDRLDAAESRVRELEAENARLRAIVSVAREYVDVRQHYPQVAGASFRTLARAVGDPGWTNFVTPTWPDEGVGEGGRD